MSLDEDWGAEPAPGGVTTLRDLIAGKPAEQRRALLIIRQVLEALATVHTTGAVHGDIRPETIIVTTALGKDTVKLGASAGAAKTADPVYRAPEAALGATDARTDIYAIGAVLFELLTGRPPFFADDADGLRRLHAYAPLQPLKQRAPDVGFADSLETMVATALAKKRDSRFGSAAAMIEAIDRALSEIETATPATPATPPGEGADGANDSLRLLAQDLMPQARHSEPSLPLVPVNVGREVPQLPWQARASQSVRRRIDRASSKLRISRRALVGAVAAALALGLVLSIVMCTGSSSSPKPSVGSGEPVAAPATPTAAKSLPARCVLLARACGEGEKRVTKIGAECSAAAEKQIERGCAAKAIAAYECYQSKLCRKGDPIWALDDLRVLSGRKGACVAEGNALRACVDNARP